MSTSKNFRQQLIFGSEASVKIKSPDTIDEDLEKYDDKREFLTGPRRPSAYVEIFESTVRTVLEHEHKLFSQPEINALEHFSRLCYNARYCLIRLVLRKVDQWHPISTLDNYTKEVGEEGLHSAIADLCRPLSTLLNLEPIDTVIKTESIDSVKLEFTELDICIKNEEPPNIDLSMDTDEDHVKPDITTTLAPVFENYWARNAGPSRLPLSLQSDGPIQILLQSDPSVIDLDFFCEDESSMSTREILGRLVKEQLVGLAKDMKCKLKPNAQKCDIVYALQVHAATQQVLNFGPCSSKKGKGKAQDERLRQTHLNFPFKPKSETTKPKTSQEQRLRDMAMSRLGKCVRVNFDFYRLVRRLHIVCYRETEHPTSLLLPALLSTFKKRNYAPYSHSRTTDVWFSREELLEYEQALELDKMLDDIMQEQPETNAQRKRLTKTPARRSTKFLTPTPGRNHTTPLRSPSTASCLTEHPNANWGEIASAMADGADGEVFAPPKKEERIRTHFNEWIYPKWQHYVGNEAETGCRIRPPGLERFDAGHVYTRMVHKAAQVFGPLKDYELELATLDSLLEQRFWSQGKRAKWYTRRAIILDHHLARSELDVERKEEIVYRALRGVKDALLDDETGMVWRPSLVKRLEALEKKLKIPLHERSQCSGELRMARIVELEAVKIPPLMLDAYGRPVNDKDNSPDLHRYMSMQDKEGKTPEEVKPVKKKMGKSKWKGRDGIVDVEARALEWYEDQGYKGFHSETRILTTIFGLLCWDIIFADVPGAFDTPYQRAPLDLLHDSFYRARKNFIEKRLEELRNGQGCNICKMHDDLYRDKAMICAGVSWDLCSKEDLLDIIGCLSGESLATICQLFCEDYGGRCSGGPDLFVWNTEKRICKFVEVKGPGDVPQENQKLWFDSLLRASADVEICKVIDIMAPKSTKKAKGKPSGSSKRKRAVGTGADEPESEQEEYNQLDHEREEAGAANVVQSATFVHHLSPNKRRRILAPEEVLLGQAAATMLSPTTPHQNPSPSQRGAKIVEVLITPRKRKSPSP